MNPHGRRRLLASAALVPAWAWLAPGPAWAQASAAAASASRRVALVIGNGRYAQAPLPNPERDARLVANTLRSLQFEADLQLNLKAREFKRVLREFGRRMDDDNTALVFYYAGHGMQIDRRNYLLPVDLNLRDEDEVRDEAVDLAETLLARIDRVRPRARIFIVDACRDNPFAGRPSSGQRHSAGLAEMAAPGALIAFSAAPGKAAEDGPPGTNSIYSRILAQEMRSPGLEVEEMLKNVRVRVLQETQERQIPWVNTSMVVNFMFNPTSASGLVPTPPPGPVPAPQQPAPLPRPVPSPPAPVPEPLPPATPAPGQRSLRLVIEADRQLNTDQRQAPASLALRLYLLRDGQAFQRASFDSLYDHDEATLGAALLKREMLHLRPGETRELDLAVPPDARQLGVFAAFREVEQARWRVAMVLSADDLGTPLRLQAKARQVLLAWAR